VRAQPRNIEPPHADRRPAVSTLPMAAMPTDSITRRFAVACGVLSQHVRNGGAPFLTKHAQAGAGAGAGPAAAQEMIAGSPQQLTILYGGRVVVLLDACPPEKAAELIRLAAAAAQQGPQPPPEQALVDMPIARKASLRRFLAKRKDRSSFYEDDETPEPKKGKMAAASEEHSSSWLALGSLCSMHGR
jgi:jasmonate ZIM domain-containing protein